MEQMSFDELTERVVTFYHQKKLDEALQMLEQQLDSFPEQAARLRFWQMCFLSLAGRSEEVFSVFGKGLDSGLWWHEELFSDPDLNSVRDLPEFQRLMSISQARYDEERSQIERDFTVLEPEPPASGVYSLLVTLHGRNGNKDGDLGRWELARQRGWLVLSAQSTQPVFQGAYHWDDPEQGLADLLFYYDQVSHQYQIDPDRFLIAGFSQGSGMAIYTALRQSLPVRGFIGIGTWWANPSQLDLPAGQLRGYFITGEKDHTLERAREIQAVLRKNDIEFTEEVHADLGHEFSSDFGTSFDRGIGYIFRERE